MTSMSVSDNPDARRSSYGLLTRTGWVWAGVLTVAFIFLHWHLIRRMVMIGLSDQNWSHIMVVPLISLYYIYTHRERIQATERRVCLWGLPLMIFGVFGFAMGIAPIRNDMAMGYSMILTLFGLLLLLLGPAMMRILWFPAAFLVFAIKVSDAIWNQIAAKLQGVAAQGSVLFLNALSPLTDMRATLRGSTIDLDYTQAGMPIQQAMNVAEACSGLRMLMAFVALGVALAFLFPRSWWQRVIMMLLAAPIAVFVNVLRVTTLGLLHLIDPSLAHGDFHIFVGMLMLIPAAGLLMLVGWCLDQIIITDKTRQAAPPPIKPSSDPTRIDFDLNRTLRGLGLGALCMAAASGIYGLLLNIAIGYEWLGPAVGYAFLIVLLGLLLGAAIFLPRWMPTRGTENGMPRLHMAFGLGAGVLLLAGVTQATMIQAANVAMIKDAVPLRHDLASQFPPRFGHWDLLLHRDRLPKDVETELGTDKYFTRWYLDANSGLTVADLKGADAKQIDLSRVQPGDIAELHMTYYTGMADTVPHVPDRCWLAAGMEFLDKKIVTLNLPADDWTPAPDGNGLMAPSELMPEARMPSSAINAVMFVAADEEGRRHTVLYFFIANGRFLATPHEVRALGFDFRDRYSYYCKVELQFRGVEEPEEVKRRAEVFLGQAMPQIMACLPDWVEVRAGLYPRPEGTPQPTPRSSKPNTDQP